ncbi:MAG: DinB family protein [Chlorobiota bacterium]|jgi:uncharacterized damage-inducible protein DinB|nr:DinB family protein [Chlorobiota bacterium]QQS67050.1 MAG: DinB family protein [Chlorobiota bacterium]
MSISSDFLAELRHESNTTKKLLELVPFDKAEWAPHEKSMKLGRLARHVADLPDWVNTTITTDELDFAKSDSKPFNPQSNEELIAHFNEHLKKAVVALENSTDELLQNPWTMRQAERVFFTLPKQAVLRDMCFNHFIHHRAQLGVYLRMLDIPLPGSYGPSADTPNMM